MTKPTTKPARKTCPQTPSQKRLAVMQGADTDRALGHVLVTGASGFLGRALVARIKAQGGRATGLTRQDVDQRDARAVHAMLGRIQPDIVIDAAGVTPGRGDVGDNVTMTQCWVDAIAGLDRAPRLVFVGSAAVFGDGAAQDRATREDDPMLPTSDYGRAKLEALQIATVAAETGSDVQVGIVFNLMGAGQPDHLAPQVFVQRALETPKGKTYDVGPVGAVRDFMDIHDAADALIALARYGHPGTVANIATGHATRIGEILALLKSCLGVDWVSQGNANDARGDYACFGDPTRLMQMTGWAPRLDLETALDQIIEMTRQSIQKDTRTAS
ncbi:MAG: NAD(P)-dependent oxidoreductase [Paracoccaceae bacterium]